MMGVKDDERILDALCVDEEEITEWLKQAAAKRLDVEQHVPALSQEQTQELVDHTYKVSQNVARVE